MKEKDGVGRGPVVLGGRWWLKDEDGVVGRMEDGGVTIPWPSKP